MRDRIATIGPIAAIAAAFGLRRGLPLPTRLPWAVGEFVSAIEESPSRDVGADVEFP